MMNATEMIEAARAYRQADQDRMASRPAGHPRYDWRLRHPTECPAWIARDTAFETAPRRLLTFDSGNCDPRDLWVWAIGRKPRVVEHIDLTAADVAARLARYVAD